VEEMMSRKFFGVVLALSLSSAMSAAIIQYRPLPIANLNEAAGATRSNVSFAETDPGLMDGDDFNLAPGFLYKINAITVWSVASTFGEALGTEFSTVSLYGGLVGDPLTQLETGTPGTTFNGNDVGSSNANITHTLVNYSNFEDYEAVGAPGAFFPIWQTTFSNLNLYLYGGQTYQYAVQGIGASPDPFSLYGYWFSHGSNALNSGNLQQGDGRFRIFDSSNLSTTPALVNPFTAGLWDKGGDLNIILDIEVLGPVPEPSTYAMMLTGLAGVIGLARRRKA
jgi:hypothetical protein